jgi:hypothetical protein
MDKVPDHIYFMTGFSPRTSDLRVFTTTRVPHSHHGRFFMGQHPLVGQGLLIFEASRSHSDTPHSLGLLWTSDQHDAYTST